MWSMSRCPKNDLVQQPDSKPSSHTPGDVSLAELLRLPIWGALVEKSRCLWVKVDCVQWWDIRYKLDGYSATQIREILVVGFKHRDELQWLKECKSASLNLLLTSNVIGASTVIQGTVKGWHSQQFLAYDWLMLFAALGWPWSGYWAFRSFTVVIF